MPFHPSGLLERNGLLLQDTTRGTTGHPRGDGTCAIEGLKRLRSAGHAEIAVMVDFTKLNLLGDSVAFTHVLQQVDRLARCEATVLIDGETGTGKELVARAIHYLSPRR